MDVDRPAGGDDENAAPASTPRAQLQANRDDCERMERELGAHHERRAALQVHKSLQSSSETKWLTELLVDRSRVLSRRLDLVEKMLAGIDELHAAIARGTEMLSKRRADAERGASADFDGGGELRLRANDAIRRFKHIADSMEECDQRKRCQVAEQRRVYYAQVDEMESSLAQKMADLGQVQGARFDIDRFVALCNADKGLVDAEAERMKKEAHKLQANVADQETSYRHGIAAECGTLESAVLKETGERLAGQVAERNDELLQHEEAGGAQAEAVELHVDKLTDEVNEAMAERKQLIDKIARAQRKLAALALNKKGK